MPNNTEHNAVGVELLCAFQENCKNDKYSQILFGATVAVLSFAALSALYKCACKENRGRQESFLDEELITESAVSFSS